MNNVRDFGAVGDGVTKNTAAIQKAIDAGGMVFFPPGIYVSGTLYLKSNGGLELAPGAILKASSDKADYNADDFCPQNRVFAVEKVSGAHFITAVEQHNIVIRGGGRIDGNRMAFYDTVSEKYPKYQLSDWRPGQMIFLCECENVTLADVELYHAPYWTCFLHGCEQVTIHGLRIWNDHRTPNGDGIDIDCCRFVTVSDCIVDSGDDCITLRGYSEPLKNPKHCEYVTITNCILSTPCCAFRIGVGNGIVRQCTISNIVIHHTRSGIQVISRYSPSSPGVTVEDIVFSDLFFDCIRPVAVQSDVRGPQDAPVKPIRRIHFRNLNGMAKWSNLIESNRPGDLEEILFSEVNFRFSGGEDVSEGENLVYGEFGVKNAPAAFHIENAGQIEFDRVKIQWKTDVPTWKYGILAVNSSEIRTENCRLGKPNSINGKIS